MLIYNKKLSVSPLTTHIPLSMVSKKLNKILIIKKVKVINDFYKKFFNTKPNFAVLGLIPLSGLTLSLLEMLYPLLRQLGVGTKPESTESIRLG